MNSPHRILVFQTAFLGDVVLTLPLAQYLKENLPGCTVSFVAIPAAASVLEGHPAIDAVIVYDKKRSDRGVRAAVRLVRSLRGQAFDLALVPHRSLRSSLIVLAAGIPRRIGFETSAGSMLFTDLVPYRRDAHEIDRNLSLLRPLGVQPRDGSLLPEIHPSEADREAVDGILRAHQSRVNGFDAATMVAMAPGSVWKTKRWPEAKFAALASSLVEAGLHVAFVGGEEDRALCARMSDGLAGVPLNAAGILSPVQSADLIRRCRVLVSNDSAPAHLAAAVRTPVIAIFGATVPAFGFAPRGPRDSVIEIQGLSCRPCGVHGGQRCPIKTFDCMERIVPNMVYDAVIRIAGTPNPLAG